MARRRTYYTLLQRDYSHKAWCIQFGDYVKSVVVDELNDYLETGNKKRNLRIIATFDDQASIDSAVAMLNEGKSL